MNYKATILSTIIFLVSGCSSVSNSLTENNISSKLKGNGHYSLTKKHNNGNTSTTTYRFLKDKNKLKSWYIVKNSSGKNIKKSLLESSYSVNCYNERCKINFSEETKTMVYDYFIPVDKEGNLFDTSTNKKLKYKFIKD